MEKKRLDVIMVEQNLAASRERAKALIMAGEVIVSGKTVTKAGEMVLPDSEIIVKETCPYVSRGGWKLEKAMACFPIQLSGKVCADIGAVSYTHLYHYRTYQGELPFADCSNGIQSSGFPGYH